MEKNLVVIDRIVNADEVNKYLKEGWLVKTVTPLVGQDKIIYVLSRNESIALRVNGSSTVTRAEVPFTYTTSNK
jgi:hypothetical protein